MEEWENILSEPNQEQSLLRWIAGDVDESFGLTGNNSTEFDAMTGVSSICSNLNAFSPSGFVSTNSTYNGHGKIGSVGLIIPPPPPSSSSNNPIPDSFPPGMVFHHHHQIEPIEKKLQISNQNPNFFMPLPQMNPKLPFFGNGDELFIRKQQEQQEQHLGFPQGLQFLHPQKPLMDELHKAAELVETGNFSHAQGILARLNQHLSPIGKPFNRAAFYFKRALQLLLLNPVSALQPKSPTPLDVILKMGAYKVFSEVSPLIQFVNFTCNQALLEAMADANTDRIHIIDFDIGFGAQWASFMQELPRNRGTPSLKITAFASSSTHHPIEILLIRENLSQFANEIGITFELDVVNFDSLDQNCYSLPIFRSSENEAIAVNFPVWSSSNHPSALPSLLHFVKQLSPKLVVALDRGCDRTDLPFPQHILHALQSYAHLFESLDAVNLDSDSINKIEKFLLQPRIESTVLGRLRGLNKMPNWKTMFTSAGFYPVTFSNFTETQAECLIKRAPVKGFHVQQRQALLVLCWQRKELISASAWRC